MSFSLATYLDLSAKDSPFELQEIIAQLDALATSPLGILLYDVLRVSEESLVTRIRETLSASALENNLRLNGQADVLKSLQAPGFGLREALLARYKKLEGRNEGSNATSVLR